ncbi:MAG: caspase family protein [Nitrospirota bacterium]
MNAVWMIFVSAALLASCTAKSVPKVHYRGSDAVSMELAKPAPGITVVAVSRDGSRVLTADNAGAALANPLGKSIIRLWDIPSGELIKVRATDDVVTCLEFSPDGKFAVLAGRGGLSTHPLKLLDLSSGELVWERFRGARFGGNVIEGASFSPDGKYILASGSPISLIEAASGTVVRTIGSGYYARAVFSPDGRYILAGDKTFKEFTLLDAKTGMELRRFKGHASGFSFIDSAFLSKSLSFSPDGRYAMSTTALDDTVLVWDVGTGRELRRFSGFEEITMGYRVISSSFSPDGRSALIQGFPFKIWDLATGAGRTITGKYELQITSNPPAGASFTPNGRNIVFSYGDGGIRIVDAASAREVAMMVGFEDGEWITITSEGYYTSSEKGARSLNVNAGGKKYDTDLFYDVFYRPDIVRAKLQGEDISGLVTITMEDAIKAPPPAVAFTGGTTESGRSAVKVCYEAASTGGGIGEVRVFHNGKLVRSDGFYRELARPDGKQAGLLALNSRSIYETMRGVVIRERAGLPPIRSAGKGERYEECAEIEAVPGENEVGLTAFNSSNTVQSPMKTITFASKLPPEEPHLYVLSLGIDRYRDSSVSLTYAVKDAKDMVAKLTAQASTLYQAKNIHHELIADAGATKTNIMGRINELAAKVKPTDSFILFVAGHGVLLQNQYFMLTHDYAGELGENVLISANEIVDMSKKIRSLSQLFIFDTCHAGGVDAIVSGLYDARMSVLAKKMGLHIYASASSFQEAKDGYRGNGLFTHTLLDGLNNKKDADKNADKKVSLVELGEYAKTLTSTLSAKIGHSQTPLIINFGRDSALYGLR